MIFMRKLYYTAGDIQNPRDPTDGICGEECAGDADLSLHGDLGLRLGSAHT
jgi:hypothetical protein